MLMMLWLMRKNAFCLIISQQNFIMASSCMVYIRVRMSAVY